MSEACIGNLTVNLIHLYMFEFSGGGGGPGPQAGHGGPHPINPSILSLNLTIAPLN